MLYNGHMIEYLLVMIASERCNYPQQKSSVDTVVRRNSQWFKGMSIAVIHWRLVPVVK